VTIDDWLWALQARHRSALTTSEFLKAVRALSARYVECRAELPGRSPLDSAGKRAAFAAFYAPLHFLTTRQIVRALQPARVTAILDLGCGTGVASAAWALEQLPRPRLVGIDTHAWALDEARRTWRELGLRGEARRDDICRALERWRRAPPPAIVAGWSVNELSSAKRDALLPQLLSAGRSAAQVLVIEPVAGGATPWWDEWEAAFRAEGGRADRWKFDFELPPSLRTLDEAAGFRREGLSAKSLSLAQRHVTR
jgi:SAM-dependent methyltransferase